MTEDETTCLTLLRSVIAKLKPFARSLADSKYIVISSYVTDQFDPLDLVVDVGEIKVIEQVESEKEVISIDFIDVGDCRQRAKFAKRITDGSWGMESLKFECPVCFGEGVNDGEACPVCHGEGWGVQ